MNYSYETLAELVAASRKPCTNAANVQHLDNVSGRGFICADRREVSTYSQANAELSRPLFEAGAARVEKLAREIVAPTPQSIKRKLLKGAEGDELDMHRVWAGDLERAWTRARRTRTVSVSRVLVCVYMSANATVDSAVIAWRGVAGLALCEALEAAGYSVAVRAIVQCDLTDAKRTPYSLEVTAKHESEPLDLHKAANLLASTLLFRGVVFQHLIAHAPLAISSGLGSDRPERATVDWAGFDHVALVTDAVRNAATASAWVSAQVAILDARNGA